MEIRRYVAPLLKWWWLIVAATVVAGISAEYTTRDIPLVYNAHTTLIVGRAIFDPNPSSYDFGLSNQLAQSYADVARREPVRGAAMTALGLSELPKYEARPKGQLLEIIVTDTSPERAQAVANELARQLILISPGNPGAADIERQAFINQQLEETETSIKDTKAKIAELQSKLGQVASASELADTQTQIKALEDKLTTLQSIYANLLSTAQAGSINTVAVLEAAALPQEPVGPSRLLIIALAAAGGLVLAAGAAYLLEYLSDTFDGLEDIADWLRVPVIGYIAEMRKWKGKRPYVADQPYSMIADAFRTLSTNIELAETEKPIQIISLCSASPSDGKSSTAINLAIVTARAGKKVLLVDADLRRPALHRFLGLPNPKGFAEILRGEAETQDVIQSWEEDNLGVITAGHLGGGPTEALNPQKLGGVLSHMRALANVIIVDGPPFFTADATILASRVDGVLLVIRPGHSRKPAIQAMLEHLTRSGARILGVTANRVPSRQVEYYYGRHLSYYTDSPKAAATGVSKQGSPAAGGEEG